MHLLWPLQNEVQADWKLWPQLLRSSNDPSKLMPSPLTKLKLPSLEFLASRSLPRLGVLQAGNPKTDPEAHLARGVRRRKRIDNRKLEEGWSQSRLHVELQARTYHDFVVLSQKNIDTATDPENHVRLSV